MKTSIMFVIFFSCSLYVYGRSSAMKLSNGENTDILPNDGPPHVIMEANTEPGILEIIRVRYSEPGILNLQREDNSEPDNSDMQQEDNSEPDTSDMQREDIFEPENSDMQQEDNSEPDTLDLQREDNPEPNTTDILRKGGKKSKSARNCLDLKKQGKSSGAFMINPCDDDTTKVVKVYCDMDTDGGGWTVIQRRDNYLYQQGFYYSWVTYGRGFGDVMKDFWLGNDNIHCLTEQNHNELRVDIEYWSGNPLYANYDLFYVDGRINRYKLTVQNYTGNATDRLTWHNNMYFSTYDKDNDGSSSNCASRHKGGWWYRYCYASNLNGVYNGTSGTGLYWSGYSKMTEMKIRAKK